MSTFKKNTFLFPQMNNWYSFLSFQFWHLLPWQIKMLQILNFQVHKMPPFYKSQIFIAIDPK